MTYFYPRHLQTQDQSTYSYSSRHPNFPAFRSFRYLQHICRTDILQGIIRFHAQNFDFVFNKHICTHRPSSVRLRLRVREKSFTSNQNLAADHQSQIPINHISIVQNIHDIRRRDLMEGSPFEWESTLVIFIHVINLSIILSSVNRLVSS